MSRSGYLPCSVNFDVEKLAMNDPEEVEKVRVALRSTHSLVDAFNQSWKLMGGTGSKESRFVEYLKNIEDNAPATDDEPDIQVAELLGELARASIDPLPSFPSFPDDALG